MSALPAWAENMRPVDMEGAAALLGIARRTLVDVIRHNPHYEKRGVKKVFYPEHIAQSQFLRGSDMPGNARVTAILAAYLGKGEAGSSILPCSTRNPQVFRPVENAITHSRAPLRAAEWQTYGNVCSLVVPREYV